jgi:hypothetical protein
MPVITTLVQWTDVVRQLNALALSGIIDDITAHSLNRHT